MKKIAITQRLANNETYFEQREMLDIAWGSLFLEIGLLPVVLPYNYDFKKYFQEFDIEGIFLSGGNDLNLLNQNELSQKRDSFEKELISYGIENKIPIFGVCRGLQIIVEYFGGSFKAVQEQVGTKDRLKVNSESKYFPLLSQLGTVNSYHNYGVDGISDSLIVSAYSEKDKVIKAIEHKEHKIFAQMWHSEREKPFPKEELNLIKEFFQ